MLYKIINGAVAITSQPYLQPKLRISRTHPLTSNHIYQTNINAFKYSFSPEQSGTVYPHKSHSDRPPQLILLRPASIATLSLNKITTTMPFLSLHQKTHDCTCMIMLHLMIFSHTITNVSLFYFDI